MRPELEWETVELSQICTYRHERIEVGKLTTSNYISTANMLPEKGGIRAADGLPKAKTASKFYPGDVLVSNIRPYFKKIWLATREGGCSNDVLVMQARDGTHAPYLYYLLSSDAFFAHMTATAKGTKMPRGDKDAIMGYMAKKPPLDVQCAFADTLACLDRKIAVNDRVCRNLEEQAQLIFKRWFVDFAPFRSCGFVQSELGLIPKGWQIVSILDMVVSTFAGDWGKAEPEGNFIQKVGCIRGTDLPDVQQGSKGKIPVRYIQTRNLLGKRLQADNLVVEISGGSPVQSTGRIARISRHLLNRFDADLICTNFCSALAVKSPYSIFLYHFWLYLYGQGRMFGYENGTTGIKNFDLQRFLKNTLIALPPRGIVEEFNELMEALEAKVYSLASESEVLANLRDTILPPLISGALDLPRD